ncbi:N-acetylmannosamine kinase [Streptomyces griseomycini]
MSSQQFAVPARGDVLIAALDIGGTKIAGALVTSAGALVHHVRRATPAQESADTLLDAVYQVVNALAAAPLWEDVRALGIGSAGPVDLAHGSVSPVNIPAWRDFPLVESVSAHPALAHRPVVLAAEAGVSRPTLARRFTTLVGRPPMAYLTWWRVIRAAALLRDTPDTRATIAGRVGYGSPYALSHAFQREFGTTPGRYRAQAAKRSADVETD